jgi:hypothetical protein
VRADACPGVADADCIAPVARALADQSAYTFSTQDWALGEVLAAYSPKSDLETLVHTMKNLGRWILDVTLMPPSAGLDQTPAAL